jgi:hypothetical protein
MERRLRAIEGDEPAAEAGAGWRTPGWLPLASAVLVVALFVLLVWTRLSLGGRIEALEGETANLREAVATRDRVIGEQSRRLGDVRDRLDDLRARLDEARALLEPAP